MPEGTTQHSILMIDDEANARKVVKLLLEREGYRVLTAPNGEEGLILAKVERPHVILLDVMMPKLSGFDTLKRLRDDEDVKHIPVIMVTARGSEHDIATSFKLGAIFHVEKPYETKDLLQKIQIAIQSGEPGAAA
jgi:DNA-binding response OmpR family regulator